MYQSTPEDAYAMTRLMLQLRRRYAKNLAPQILVGDTDARA